MQCAVCIRKGHTYELHVGDVTQLQAILKIFGISANRNDAVVFGFGPGLHLNKVHHHHEMATSR